MKTHSTLTSFGAAVARAIDCYGLDSRALFKRGGLDLDALKNPNARYHDSELAKLMRTATEATGDPAFGLAVARAVEPTTLHALGFSVLASPSLHSALLRIERYYRIVSDGVEIELDKVKQEHRLQLRCRHEDQLGPGWADAMLATLLRVSRWIAGSEFAPLKVMMKRARPESSRPFEDYFGVAPQFGCQNNSLLLDSATMARELATSNAELAYQNDKIVADYLARFDSARLSERVRTIFIERLVTGKFSEEQIAEQLNLSLRSMQRRLRDEQTSYQQLLDETRLDLSLQYINRTSLTVAQIAPLLGFSDSSNFNRAFKRWLGISPSKYRALGFG